MSDHTGPTIFGWNLAHALAWRRILDRIALAGSLALIGWIIAGTGPLRAAT